MNKQQKQLKKNTKTNKKREEKTMASVKNLKKRSNGGTRTGAKRTEQKKQVRKHIQQY